MLSITPKLLNASEDQLGYQVVSGELEDNYFILFIRDFKICGHIKSLPGGGNTWDIPSDVAALSEQYTKNLYENLEQS